MRAVLTETVGLPVHAILTPERDSTAAVADVIAMFDSLESSLVTFANPATAILARRSAHFRRELASFDFIFPDGIGMCMAIKLLHNLPARRLSFDTTSLAPAIFELAQLRGLRVVLVGGKQPVADKARARIIEHFPGLQVLAAFDGYGDISAKLTSVAALLPDIVVCGMGGGKQESFLLGLRAFGWRGWGFTCGGYLDQLCNGMTYYPLWIDATHLRWMYRLAREPRRLWRRYLIEYSHFVLLLCGALVDKHWHMRAGKRGVVPTPQHGNESRGSQDGHQE